MNSILESARLVREDGNRRLFDFGKASFCRIQLANTGKGGNIKFAAGECIKDGWLDSDPGKYRRYYAAELTIPAGCGTFEVEFPPHVAPNSWARKCPSPAAPFEVMPLRYVEITGDLDLSVNRHSYYGGFNDEASSFESSSDALNELWDFCKYSIKATNCFECYVDGDRERLPYEADAYVNKLSHFCMDTEYSKGRNTISRLLESPTWPIEYRLLMPIVVWNYLLYSGDTSCLEAWKAPLTDGLFLDRLDENSLLPEHFDYICNHELVRTIVDWPVVERDNCEFAEKPMTITNSYLYAALLAMENLYGGGKYRELAEKVKASLHRLLKKDGIFVDNTDSTHSAIQTLTHPIVWGVADEAECAKMMPLVESKGLPCSVYGAQFVLESCYMCKYADHALKLLTRRGERSWLGMIDQGSTISMEAWSNALKPNQDWNHAWGAAPGNVIPRWLCGIRPTAPGFKEFIVAPQPADLEFFRFVHPTGHGKITVEYHKDSGTKVTFPNGKSDTFANGSRTYTIDGAILA